jgi:hypothetical protein
MQGSQGTGLESSKIERLGLSRNIPLMFNGSNTLEGRYDFLGMFKPYHQALYLLLIFIG